MKIWVIGRDYPTVSNNMWGSFEFEQAKLLAKHGHQVSYIALTLSFFSRGDKRGFRQFEDSGVSIYACSRLYFPGKAGIYLPAYEDRCWENLMEKALAGEGLPDVIHVHYPTMISSTNVIQKFRQKGVKIFVTEHWSRVLIHTLKSFEKDRMSYYAACADGYFAVGRPLQNAIRESVEVKAPMDVVPNMVSPLFKPGCGKKQEDGSFTFLTVGRLSGIKQFDAVIRQFLQNFGERKDVRLKIIGSGESRGKLGKLASGSDQIEFLGTIPLSEVAEQIAKADALVSFSRYETFGVPVIEAWACGKPAIVSSQSGAADYVNNDLGLVVSSEDQEGLGKAMVTLRENIGKFDSSRISSFAQAHFSGDAVYEKLITAYTDCSSSPQRD